MARTSASTRAKSDSPRASNRASAASPSGVPSMCVRKRLVEVIAKAIGVALLAPGCAGRTGPRAQEHEAVVCPHDAVAVGGACRCAPGLFVLEGACVGSRELDAYCGVVTRGAGVCPTPVCRNEDPIDLATETCGTAGSAREI